MITTEQLKLITPAVFAESPDDKVSDLYTFIPTTQLVSDFEKLGWYVERARQQKSKNMLHTKHMLVFRSPDLFAVNGLFPEIITINSHNRLSAFHFMIGLFRSICMNGLVIADKTFESVRIRHIHYQFQDLEYLTNTMVENIPQVFNHITKLQNVNLTQKQEYEFAIKALACRFKEYVNDEGVINERAITYAVDIDSFLQPQREEDNNSSIWAVYNRVQEKLMNGGFQRIGTKDNRAKRTRSITNIKLDVTMNQALWQLANEYLPN